MTGSSRRRTGPGRPPARLAAAVIMFKFMMVPGGGGHGNLATEPQAAEVRPLIELPVRA